MNKRVMNYLISGKKWKLLTYCHNDWNYLWRISAMSPHASRDLLFQSMTSTSPASGSMISRIKWNLRTRITYQLHLTSSKRNRFNVYKTVTLTGSCKEIVFPFCVLVSLTPIPSYPPCPWHGVGHYTHSRYMGQWIQCHRFVLFGIRRSSFCII